MSTPLLQTRALGMRFGGVAALGGIDLSVQAGSIHSVIGPNGAGKTTLFDCICQSIAPGTGEVFLDGERLNGLKPDRVAAAGLGRTHQTLRLFRNLSAVENLLVGMHLHIGSNWLGAVLNTKVTRRKEAAAHQQALQLLDFAGLAGRGERRVRELAYDEQRRLEIARALAASPRLLLLDEPVAGMNERETAGMIEFIQRVRQVFGMTIVLIEHQMHMVMALSDRITVLDRGLKIAEGTPAQVQVDPRVIDAYLGAGIPAQERS